tara:strand:- start:183 stop:608 length:426 start_codon:yes stop_codon:yes gene_type:complete
MFSKIIAAIVGGFIISMVGSMLVGLSVGAGAEGGAIASSAFFVLYIVSFVVSLRSNSSKQAWKRLLITASILSFLLPISSVLYTGMFIAEETSSAAGAAGGLIGGALITSITGIFGFFMGVVFLIIGLLIKDEKESNQEES